MVPWNTSPMDQLHKMYQQILEFKKKIEIYVDLQEFLNQQYDRLIWEVTYFPFHYSVSYPNTSAYKLLQLKEEKLRKFCNDTKISIKELQTKNTELRRQIARLNTAMKKLR